MGEKKYMQDPKHKKLSQMYKKKFRWVLCLEYVFFNWEKRIAKNIDR